MAENITSTTPKHTEYDAQSDIPFQKVDHLGKGAYGIVDKVQRGSQFYARKTFTIYKHQKRKLLDQISQEVKMITAIQHIHAVRLVETYACKLEYAMIMTPVADGNLADYIHDMAEGPRDHDRLRMIPAWFGCLLSAMSYLHEKNIHHRDVKPQNILHLGQNILFTDFGIAREFVEKTHTESTAVTGTRSYWAPEVDEGVRPGRKADIFSLGLVFLEMLAVYLNSDFLPELWSLQPYSRNLSDVHKWIYGLDMQPVEVEWYPTMVFICRHMLQKNKGVRPYASALAICWCYRPFSVMPPVLCDCLGQFKLEDMNDARQIAKAHGNQLALQLLLRRGTSVDGSRASYLDKQTLSFSKITHVSTLPYERRISVGQNYEMKVGRNVLPLLSRYRKKSKFKFIGGTIPPQNDDTKSLALRGAEAAYSTSQSTLPEARAGLNEPMNLPFPSWVRTSLL